MSRRITISLIALGMAFGLGCAGKKHLSPEFGKAQERTHERMIADPLAGTQPTPEGLDARSAEHVLQNYSKGQKAQKHPRPKGRRGTGIQIINN